MNFIKNELANITDPKKQKGSLADVLKGADVFIGLSGPYVLNHKMVKSMAKNSIVFALSNPPHSIKVLTPRVRGCLDTKDAFY